MKSSTFFVILFVLIALSFASCKKCFDCSTPSYCGQCRYNNNTLDVAACQSENPTGYQALYTDCMAQGGTWIILDSTPDITSHCYASSNTAAINAQEAVCESAGGTWK